MFNFKRHFPQNSLKNQLFRWLLLLLLPLIFISIIAGYFLANHFTNQVYDKSLYRTALALAGQVDTETPEIQVHLPKIARDLLEFDEDDDVYFRIIGPNGDLVSTHTSLPLPKKYPAADRFFYYETSLNNEDLRVIIYALPKAQNNQKDIYILVGETQQKRMQMADEIILSMLLPQLLIGLLVGALLFFGIKRGLMPLEKLKTELITRNSNDLSPVDHSAAPTELKPLLESFNDLLAKVANNIAKQQRFIADASHQLRTPLAGLKTQAELALREQSPDKIAHALNQINVASGNLSHLVSQLLSLTKAEPSGSVFLETETLDFSQLAQLTTADWVVAALEKNIDLGFIAADKNLLIKGNAVLLRELMNNLIENAILYTANGGNITVGIKREANDILLYVQDDGIGIAPDQQDLVFERFYRVLGTQQTGCGLGLTIVQEIAERHSATVSIDSKGEGLGSLFTVRFTAALS
ncbi:sensor histidine kinase [Methylotenera versatilis]|uniref:sensor histidine kinase n=1 Tax=Methylotenera versatilis TaxID=1055487 RepID=UPI0006475E00|nr:sensor histidine kinase [Methylotenera versatilis]